MAARFPKSCHLAFISIRPVACAVLGYDGSVWLHLDGLSWPRRVWDGGDGILMSA